MTMSETPEAAGRWIVVIDPGHGGFDPGKIGVTGTKEKEINLAISEKVKTLLEQNDVTVIMTRETDTAVGEEKKKSSDMRSRVARMKEAAPFLAVSIHQNSFTESSSHGAQVFYYEKSSEGKELAQILQAQLKETLQDGNHRMEKANQSYYLLKNASCPIAIVECGFLSNAEEEAKLNDPEYQDKVAWAIHLGILQYLNRTADSPAPPAA